MCTMSKEAKQYERAARAERLKEARVKAGFTGVKSASSAHGWNVNNYKAHESGRNGFEIVDAKRYSKAFKVSLNWLFFGTGLPNDIDDDRVVAIDVPLIPWISAGQLAQHDGVFNFNDFPTVSALDLPEGDWVALRVVGNSMNKISPPESIIFANMKDRRLVANACYIVVDETGGATYKRYRPNETPPYQPASYDQVEPPKFEGAVSVLARVRRSVIEM